MTLTQTLHRQLVQLRGQAQDWVDGLPAEGFSPWFGICHQLDLGAPDWGRLDALLAAWPGGTGSRAFPVPHPTEEPLDACLRCDEQEMWNPEFEYARNRWALLEWLIEQTKPTKEAA